MNLQTASVSPVERLPDGDGAEIIYADEGSGPAMLIVHGGLSDESAWDRVARELAPNFRVLRIRRRLYRTDLPADPTTSIASEVDDVLRVAAAIEGPILLVGHSSGAVVALETLVTDPGPFAAAALYEPPLVLDEDIGGSGELPRARAAVASGHAGKAVQIFLRKMVQAPVWQAMIMRAQVRFDATLRSYVPRQLDDTEAMDRLGSRLDAYAAIRIPVLLISGADSPTQLRERTARLAERLAGHAVQTVLAKQGHVANIMAPRELARRLTVFYQTLLVRGSDEPTK